MSNKLSLYVWPDFQSDYYSGIAFALAHDVDEARELIFNDACKDASYKEESIRTDLKRKPKIYDKPIAFSLSGGSG